MLTAPFTNQYTFFACVPLIKATFEFAVVAKAPLVLIINTALGLPKASRYKVSVNVTAAFIK